MHGIEELDYKAGAHTLQWLRILNKPAESYGERPEFIRMKLEQEAAYDDHTLRLRREGEGVNTNRQQRARKSNRKN